MRTTKEFVTLIERRVCEGKKRVSGVLGEFFNLFNQRIQKQLV